MDSSTELVEHYFRHEYGRLVSLLTRWLGVKHLELVEDVVQTALAKAIQTWGQRGIPNEPGAWLYRTARNLALDVLRRQQLEAKIRSDESWQNAAEENSAIIAEHEISDESLRFLFLCCHPSIPLESQIALALKTVSGFSVDEVAASLLITRANAEKRITRAKEKLREIGTELAQLDLAAMQERKESVQSVLYVLFTEGYATSIGDLALRQDLCDEAIRLTRMLIESKALEQSPSCALLALMLMHSARFNSRLDTNGSIVLLEDQDRNQWNWGTIREGMAWMAQSATGDQLTRYHIEAAIAWEYCRPSRFEDTHWSQVAEYYECLNRLCPSPMVQLNAAIAYAYAHEPSVGLERLTKITPQERTRLRPWWDCAIAELYYKMGKMEEARLHWQDAYRLANNDRQRELIQSKLKKQTS